MKARYEHEIRERNIRHRLTQVSYKERHSRFNLSIIPRLPLLDNKKLQNVKHLGDKNGRSMQHTVGSLNQQSGGSSLKRARVDNKCGNY